MAETGRGVPGEVAARLIPFALTVEPPADALVTARLCLFDWTACALAGAVEPATLAVRAMLEAEGGAAQASMAGAAAMRVPARAAALANGVAGHALDYDDTHFGHVGHPSAVLFPAALALAERQRSDGATFLGAALIGAEASVRVGRWLGERHAAGGFHTTATAGAIGATLTAGRLMELDVETLGHALGVAATRASGLRAQFGTDGKPLNAGLAAATGIEAVDLAAAGLRSTPEALDGPQGFGPALGGEGAMAALIGIGTLWEMTRVSYKLHACCHGLHAMLEALSGLRIAPGTLDRLTVRTHPRWLAICDNPRPATGLEAKFSYQLNAAMALTGRRTAARETYSDAACVDPSLIALRDKVEVVGDPGLPMSAAEVEVSAAGGRAHRLRHDLAREGDPNQLPDRLMEKAVALIGPARAEALARATLGSEPDLDALTLMLRSA